MTLDKKSRNHYDGENNNNKGKTWSHDLSQVYVWSSIPTTTTTSIYHCSILSAVCRHLLSVSFGCRFHEVITFHLPYAMIPFGIVRKRPQTQMAGECGTQEEKKDVKYLKLKHRAIRIVRTLRAQKSFISNGEGGQPFPLHISQRESPHIIVTLKSD